jgi:surfeit locus 1 family protein
MIRFRPLIVMTIFAIIALVFLVIAGRWQWEKYELKTAAADEPVAEMTIASYQPVPDSIQFVYGVRLDTREQGWRVFAPVQYGDTTVFVDADFIPEISPPNPAEVRIPASLRLGAPISGASVRPEPPAPLTHAPEPLRRLWFAVDLDAMGRNGGLGNVADYYIASSYVGADGRATPNPFAAAPGADALPPARHLGYALTWYGLALVLLVIYFAYHASVGRFSLRPPRPPEE